MSANSRAGRKASVAGPCRERRSGARAGRVLWAAVWTLSINGGKQRRALSPGGAGCGSFPGRPSLPGGCRMEDELHRGLGNEKTAAVGPGERVLGFPDSGGSPVVKAQILSSF